MNHNPNNCITCRADAERLTEQRRATVERWCERAFLVGLSFLVVLAVVS